MSTPTRLAAIGAALLLAACGQANTPAPASDAAAPAEAPAEITPDLARANGAPAGQYRLDTYHASIVFAVDHIGFSNYVGQFTRFDIGLTIDPAALDQAEVSASIDPTSLIIPTPPEGFLAELQGPLWLNVENYPEIQFFSTAVTLTGPNTAKLDGNLEFLGAVQPVSMDVTFNGAYAGLPPYDPNARAGFHAEGTFSRSAFGMTYGLPPEGSTMGVGDTVKFWVDAEFHGPPAPAADEAAAETP